MLLGLGRQRWAEPSYSTINWSHPLTRSLHVCVPGWVMGGRRELLSGRYPTTINGGMGPTRVGAWGRSLGGGGAAGDWHEWTFSSGDTWAVNPPVTVAAIAQVGTLSNNASWFGLTSDNGTYTGNVLNVGRGGAGQWKFNYNNGTSGFEVGTTSASGATGIYSLVGTLNSSGSTLWVNGISNATGTAASTIDYTGGTFRSLQIHRSGGAGANDDVWYLGCIWKRVLSEREIRQFHADPFAMFRPRGVAGANVLAPGRRPVFMRF